MKRRLTSRPTLAQVQAQMQMYAPDGGMVRPPAFMERKPRKQSDKPRGNPEAKTQRAIIKWLTVCCPQILVASSMNGAHLKRGALAMKNAKTQGSLSGDPDLRLSLPGGRTIFLEVKSLTGRLSEAQIDVHNKLTRLGFPVYIVRSIGDVRIAMKAEGVECREVKPS